MTEPLRFVSDEIEIGLALAEALVLKELADRVEGDEAKLVLTKAEVRALWNLGCILEQELTEPFITDYKGALDEAVRVLTDSDL